MSNATLDDVRVDAFRATVQHLAQQEFSRLLSFVDKDSFESETGHWDRLSSGDSAAKTRKMATPETGRTWSRRVAIASPFNDAEITELEDPGQMLADPNSHITQSLGMSMGRRIDDVIIAAATGNATAVTRTAGAPAHAAVAFTAGQTVSDYTVDINFDLITEVQELFMNNDIYPEVFKVAVIGPRQVRQLMNLTEQTSADYVELKRLQNYGIAPNWLGFTWIVSTRLLEPTTAQRDCIFFTRRGLGLHMPQDMHAEVMKDPGLSYAWRPYIQINLGAVRVEDEHVVRLKIKDTSVA